MLTFEFYCYKLVLKTRKKGEYLMNEFKISLAAARVNAGLTQNDVAKIIKKATQTVVNWENGRTQIDSANLAMLCSIYNISPDNIKV